MQSRKSSVIAEEPTETRTNVTQIRLHTECGTVCSQKYGTLTSNLTITFLTIGQQCFIHDDKSRYSHNGIYFSLEDGYFKTKDFIFELPQKTYLRPFDRVALALGMALSKEDKPKIISLKEYSFKKIFEGFTMLALKDLRLIPNSFSYSKQYKYGEHVFGVYHTAVSGSGRIKASRSLSDSPSLNTNFFHLPIPQ